MNDTNTQLQLRSHTHTHILRRNRHVWRQLLHRIDHNNNSSNNRNNNFKWYNNNEWRQRVRQSPALECFAVIRLLCCCTLYRYLFSLFPFPFSISTLPISSSPLQAVSSYQFFPFLFLPTFIHFGIIPVLSGFWFSLVWFGFHFSSFVLLSVWYAPVIIPRETPKGVCETERKRDR